MRLRVTMAAMACVVAAVPGSSIAAQGCEPIRFTMPIDLGGQNQVYQEAGRWRATLAYRRLHSDEYFIGTHLASNRAPGGSSPIIDVNTLVADVAWSASDRLLLRLSVPFSTGKINRLGWPDGKWHSQDAKGLGDVSLTGEYWLANPKTHENGNLSVELGVKAPTGNYKTQSTWYTATSSIPFPADQPIQPSDGGWGIIMASQGFRRITERLIGYISGSYTANPKAQTDVSLLPNGSLFWSVPDTYNARVGVAVPVLADAGITVSVGARMDGIPLHDLFGGGDRTTIKRTSQIFLADPGLSLHRGRNTFVLNLPVRVYVNRMKSLYEQHATGPGSQNGGGFAKILAFASYSRAF